MNQDLQDYLKSKPEISKVYFNDKNEWLFVERPGFSDVLTREEVLGFEVADETVSAPKNKNKKAAEVADETVSDNIDNQ